MAAAEADSTGVGKVLEVRSCWRGKRYDRGMVLVAVGMESGSCYSSVL